MNRIINRDLVMECLRNEVTRIEEQENPDGNALWRRSLVKEQIALLEKPNPTQRELMHEGGEWLGEVREWIKQNFRNGSDVVWGSHQHLEGGTLSPWMLENLAAAVAAAAVRDALGAYVKRVQYNRPRSHYEWLEENMVTFLDAVFAQEPGAALLGRTGAACMGLIGVHGDKCYQYRTDWATAGIPFPHGVAVYLLTYMTPWSKTVRDGCEVERFVSPGDWVIKNYPKFRQYLPEVGAEFLNNQE